MMKFANSEIDLATKLIVTAFESGEGSVLGDINPFYKEVEVTECEGQTEDVICAKDGVLS